MQIKKINRGDWTGKEGTVKIWADGTFSVVTNSGDIKVKVEKVAEDIFKVVSADGQWDEEYELVKVYRVDGKWVAMSNGVERENVDLSIAVAQVMYNTI